MKHFQLAVKLFQLAVKVFQIAVKDFQIAVKHLHFAVKIFQKTQLLWNDGQPQKTITLDACIIAEKCDTWILESS